MSYTTHMVYNNYVDHTPACEGVWLQDLWYPASAQVGYSLHTVLTTNIMPPDPRLLSGKEHGAARTNINALSSVK